MDPVVENYYERRYKKNNPTTDRNIILIGFIAFVVFSLLILYFFTGPRVAYYFPDVPQKASSNLLS